jgi:hypothetical protein
MPEELDVRTRRIQQLEIEDAALAKESDPASLERREALHAELAAVPADVAAAARRLADQLGADRVEAGPAVPAPLGRALTGALAASG